MSTESDIIAWSSNLYTNGVDKKDAVAFANAFTESGALRFGNNPQLTGRDQIREAITGFFTVMQSLSHRALHTTLKDDTLVLEAEVTYLRQDGATVTVPACTIFHLAQTNPPLADDCRIYVDLAPLFAPSAS